MAIVELAIGGTEGTRVTGLVKTAPLASASAAVTLTPAQSGGTFLFDRASGVVYTLPAPVAGLNYKFFTTVTVTSNSAKVLTDAATTFIIGAMALMNNAAATGEAFSANGTTHRSVNGNGTTTGGIIGDCYEVVGLSATQWLVNGTMVQSGTAATPFATS